MMKTLAKLHQEPGIWMAEERKPSPSHRDILIKIKKTAICGTDLHIYNWDKWAQATIPVPMHIGHEFVGEVLEIGGNVSSFKVGNRVSGEGHLICGTCRNCRAGSRHLCRNTQGIGVNCPGAFAEYLVLPEENAYRIPDDISDDLAVIFDPFGNAAHAALEFDLVSEDVLITGAGPVGIMAAAIARFAGARHVVITDVNPYRLELAKKMGVTQAVNPMETSLVNVMEELGMHEGFDVGLEMSGNASAFRDMLGVMNYGGKIAYMGIPSEDFSIDWHSVVFKSLLIKGIYGRKMFDTWYKMSGMLQSGLDISSVITHHYPVAQFQEAFKVMVSGQAGKVILDWS
jgi:threonine 3-dehydrogenase